MISDGTIEGFSRNVWVGASGNTPASQITIPIGIFGVTDVWTMLNLLTGNTTARDANVTFNWGDTANGAITDTLVVKLTNSGVSSGAPAAGQVQDGILCVTGTCPGDNGATLATSTPNSVPSGSGTTVKTNVLYSFAYTAAIGSYAGTTGSVVLDDQGFIFSGSTLATSLNKYLVSVTVKEANSASGASVGLSAITVNAATPEPSTLLLLLTGLGGVGYFARSRRA